MKSITLALLALFSFHSNSAQSADSVVKTYAKNTYARYTAALDGAEKIKKAVNDFLNAPSEATLNEARRVWTEARKHYSETEVYRFYSGPIDDDDGPEGLINAWPLDEVYIDNII